MTPVELAARVDAARVALDLLGVDTGMSASTGAFWVFSGTQVFVQIHRNGNYTMEVFPRADDDKCRAAAAVGLVVGVLS